MEISEMLHEALLGIPAEEEFVVTIIFPPIRDEAPAGKEEE